MGSYSFWKNKTVLVTGFEGFLGSHLATALVRSSARVVGLDLTVKRNHTFFSKDIYKKISVKQGSVLNLSGLRNLCRKYSFDAVIHLAAQALVGPASKDPTPTFQTNIRGTWNVLEAVRCSGHKTAVVVASSDKAYGCHDHLPYRETDSICSDHPYDVSKGCADLIAHTYFNTYQMPVGITRCGNIFGPGDFHFSRLVPDAIRAVLNGRSLKIRSDGTFTRDYIFVEDVVSGNLLLAQSLLKGKYAGEAFNFSLEKPLSVESLAKLISQTAGTKPDYEFCRA